MTERRAREAERLTSISLQTAISQEMDKRGITDPHAIGVAFEMPPGKATKLLTRYRWREGDLLLLEAAAARLGVEVPGLDPWRP